MTNKHLIFLDSYTLQQDMRLRLPKSIQDNLQAQPGSTRFDIFLEPGEGFLVLKPHVVNAQSKEQA